MPYSLCHHQFHDMEDAGTRLYDRNSNWCQVAPRIERYLANMKYEYQIRRVGADPTRDFDFANNRLNVADYGPIATGSTMSASH